MTSGCIFNTSSLCLYDYYIGHLPILQKSKKAKKQKSGKAGKRESGEVGKYEAFGQEFPQK